VRWARLRERYSHHLAIRTISIRAGAVLVDRCVAQAEHDLTRSFRHQAHTGHRPRFGDTLIEDQSVIDVRKTASRLFDSSG
jgi:hypothetical protein